MAAGTVDVSDDPSRIVAVNWGERDGGNWVARSFTYADFASSTNTLDLIDIPANSFIAELYYVPKVVWNGTSPQLTVGDTDDPIEYITTDELTETSVVLVSDMMAVDGAGTYTLKAARPYFSSSGSHIQARFDFSGTPTTGEGCVIACIITVPGY